MGSYIKEPKINQCMSCSFFKHLSKDVYYCDHENENDPDLPGMCYDYKDIEEGEE